MYLEHPDITRIRRTGYPSDYQDEQVCCDRCGEECGTVYEDEQYENLCEYCLLHLHRKE